MNNPTMGRPKATPHCRVVITDKCNLTCDFCCMNDPVISDSFKEASAWYIAQQIHKEVSITGGEPLLALPRVIMFSQIVKYFNPDVKLYLYTNGELLTDEIAKILKACGIDGINISIHKITSWQMLPRYWSIHESGKMPLRFLVGEDELTKEQLGEVKGNARLAGIPVRVWKMDDCKDMPFESRYRLTDPNIRWN